MWAEPSDRVARPKHRDPGHWSARVRAFAWPDFAVLDSLDEKRVPHGWPADLLSTALEQNEPWFHVAYLYLGVQRTQALDTWSFCVQFAARRIWMQHSWLDHHTDTTMQHSSSEYRSVASSLQHSSVCCSSGSRLHASVKFRLIVLESFDSFWSHVESL